jgi:hypothetical protein
VADVRYWSDLIPKSGKISRRSSVKVNPQQSVSFTQVGGAFVLDLLSSDALGIGFDNALFQISLNGHVIDTQSFTDLASAEAFFSNNLINVPLLSGPDSIQIGFSETMSSDGGFSFDYAVASSGSRLHERLAGTGRWCRQLLRQSAWRVAQPVSQPGQLRPPQRLFRPV